MGAMNMVLFLLLPLALFSSPWIVYYGDQAPIEEFALYNPIVFDSQSHPPLGPLVAEKKRVLGYVNLGEVDEGDPWFEQVQEKGLFIQKNHNWKGSWAVDIRNAYWKRLLLKTIIPDILQQGFTG